MTKVVAIQYPSGGFGHFVHVVLSSFCDNIEGQAQQYKFGPSGNSHDYPMALPKYLNTQFKIDEYHQTLKLLSNEYATILVDAGIENDSDEFKKFINPYLSIRICYDDWAWPLLSKMFYTRCLGIQKKNDPGIENWIMPEDNKWYDPQVTWAIREKYFLYLRDHEFRYKWRPATGYATLPLKEILNYNSFYTILNQWFNVNKFEDFYKQWHNTNKEQFAFYFDCLHIINCVENKQSLDLSNIDDLFVQAVVYYYIWIKYNFEVPHNDYSNWFTNTDDIVTMLTNHGVTV